MLAILLPKLLSFLKSRWKAALAVVIALFVGFAAGHGFNHQPEKVVSKTHVEETSHVEETADVKAAAKFQEVKTKSRKRAIKVVEHTDKKPDGEVITDKTTTLADAEDTKADATSTKNTTEKASGLALERSTTDTLTVRTNQRDWRATALLGAVLQNPLTHGNNPLGQFAFGLQLEHRTNFIPLPGLDRGWIGLWALGTPSPLPGSHPVIMAGISLGVEF